MENHRDLLVMKLEAAEIADLLCRKGGLTKSEVDKVKGIPSKTEAANVLLDILQTKSSEIYEQFCEAVKKTANEATYTLLTQGTSISFLYATHC
jgi:hypothetical protein